MRNRIIAIVIGLVLLAFLLMRSCTPQKSGHIDVAPVKEAPLPAAPNFDADSAYAYVKKQVDFGPRAPGSAGHKACGDWMVAFLKQYADTVIEQIGTVTVFTGQKVPLRNIIASWRPENTQRVLLMAHWDTRPFADKDPDIKRQREPILGANDGGSGVGILLEMARHLGASQPNVGVDMFFTDVEDYGDPGGGITQESGTDSWCLGAQYWTKNPHVAGYTARFGVLLDMCGARDARFYREAYSSRFAGPVMQKVWNIADRIGVGDRFVDEEVSYVGIDDHVWVTRALHIPVIDIIQFDPSVPGFHTSWHTHNDNMDVIDAGTLSAVGRTMMQVIWAEK